MTMIRSLGSSTSLRGSPVVRLALFLSMLLGGVCGASPQNNPDKKEWTQLFNGKDLKDWDVKIAGYDLNDNYGDTFRVQDGVLKVAYDKYRQFDSRFGHIFYRQKFSYYIIAVEYRFLGTQTPGGPDWGFRNSGIMIHCQSARSMLKNQDFPISIEVQLLGGDGTATRPTANLCTPGTNVEYKGRLYTEHCLQSSARTYHGDQWVRVEAVVLGDERIRHVVEGETVLEYSKPQIGGENVANYDPAVKQDGKPLTEGYISLQAESHPLEFRKVELLNLMGCMDPKADNYKSYYVKAENSRCEYGSAPQAQGATPPEQIRLKDFRPVSIYKIPVTKISRARFPIVDMHSHPDAKTPEDVARWVKVMDEVGIERSIILAMTAGADFDKVMALYSKYPDRFEVWCGFDYRNYDKPDFAETAVKELERCVKMGARGVGEEGDKGKGANWGQAAGLHFDDPRMDRLFEKCAELKLPVNVHVADPIWMYQKMDETNDGMMNAFNWRLDNQPGIIGHSGMIDILERAAKRHPRTTFIACHFANLDYDLARLGQLLDRLPNLYADISARYAETATIPRFASQFYAKYADRLLYGTDMGFSADMYQVTFRILETLDEHFYAPIFDYHWSYSGFGLSDSILKKLYRTNALKILRR